mgnify:FL=1
MGAFDGLFGKKEESADNSLVIDSKGTEKDVSTGDVVNSQPPEIVINSQGDTKNVDTGEIHLENPQQVQEPVQPPSQNEIDLNKYDVETKSVPTVTVQDPGGNKYFPQDAHYYVEDDAWEAKEEAKVAPDQVKLVVAKEKEIADTGLGKTFNEKGEILNKTSYINEKGEIVSGEPDSQKRPMTPTH